MHAVSIICASIFLQAPRSWVNVTMPRLVHGMLGDDMKFIVILRDPVDRLHSDYNSMVRLFILPWTHWDTPRKGIHLFRYFLHTMRTPLQLFLPQSIHSVDRTYRQMPSTRKDCLTGVFKMAVRFWASIRRYAYMHFY